MNVFSVRGAAWRRDSHMCHLPSYLNHIAERLVCVRWARYVVAEKFVKSLT